MLRRIATTAVLALCAAGATAGPARADGIFGGETARSIPPWMADVRADGEHLCGGTLVHREWVLTAAHCLDGAPTEAIDVVFGRLRRSDTATGQVLPAQELLIHPARSDGAMGYDVALIHLSGSAAGPPLPFGVPGQDALWAPGRPATVIGWGMDESGDYPDDLRTLDLPMAADDECAQQYMVGGGLHEPTEVCAGDSSVARSPCYGDSGGPLFVADATGAPLLVGVVSRGYACGVVPTHSVYARVGGVPVHDWLKSTLPAPAAPAVPAAPTPPAATVPPPATAAAVRFPRRRPCGRAGRLAIRLELPAGARATAASVAVSGAGRRRWRGHVPHVLRSRRIHRKRLVVTVRVQLADGSVVKGARRYGACR
ncbi:MAG TPA: serine protease [Solirubrobacteraceae bacterium]|nr:serine protease [Solirubrobacteraceae bacterium]